MGQKVTFISCVYFTPILSSPRSFLTHGAKPVEHKCPLQLSLGTPIPSIALSLWRLNSSEGVLRGIHQAWVFNGGFPRPHIWDSELFVCVTTQATMLIYKAL